MHVLPLIVLPIRLRMSTLRTSSGDGDLAWRWRICGPARDSWFFADVRHDPDLPGGQL